MAIKLSDGLEILASAAVDSRLILTKEQMRSMSRSNMPSIYLCICSDDKKLYIFDSSIAKADIDPDTGRFRPVENYLNFSSSEESQNSINATITTAISESPSVQEAIKGVVETNISVNGGEIVDNSNNAEDSMSGGEII